MNESIETGQMAMFPDGGGMTMYALLTPKAFRDKLSSSTGRSVSMSTVYTLIKRNDFPTVLIGTRRYIVDEKVDAWFADHAGKKWDNVI